MGTMQEIDENRFFILLSPVILGKWLVLWVQNMRNLLMQYLPNDIVDSCCDHSVDNGTALRRVHRHLLLSNKNDFYSAIMHYCEQKYNALQHLVDYMWLDLDKATVGNQENDTDHELTEAQFDLLSRKDALLPKLQSALDVNTMREVLQQFLPPDQLDPLCKEPDNDKAIQLLHKKLLLKNNRLLYQEVVLFCQEQRDKYKQCWAFMLDGKDLDTTGANVVTSKCSGRQQPDDMASMKSQLAGLRTSLFDVVGDLTSRMNSFVEQANSNAKSFGAESLNFLTVAMKELTETMQTKAHNLAGDIDAMEGNLNNVISTQTYTKVIDLERRVSAMESENKSKFASQQAQLVLLRDQVDKSQTTIQQLESKVTQTQGQTEQNKKTIQNQQTLIHANEAKINHLQNTLNQTFTQMEKLEKLFDSMPTFKMPPTSTMLKTRKAYKWRGMHPLAPNEFGNYATVDWHTLFSSVDWSERWALVKEKQTLDKKNATVSLSLPLLMLPAEMGGWLIELFIKWWNGELCLCGGIASVDHNKGAPPAVNVRLALDLLVGEDVSFTKTETFTLTKPQVSDNRWLYNTLWTINDNVDMSWPTPKMKVRILP